MVKKIGIGLAIAVAGFIVGGLLLPSHYVVSRSIQIKAPAEFLYDFLETPKNHEVFSPWMANDPTLTTEYNDVATGMGAGYTWKGENSGAGQAVITKLEENRFISSHIIFVDQHECDGWWKFEANDDGTFVTWGVDGDSPGIIDRYAAVLMETFAGPKLDQGLSSLKRYIEKAYPKIAAARAAKAAAPDAEPAPAPQAP